MFTEVEINSEEDTGADLMVSQKQLFVCSPSST